MGLGVRPEQQAMVEAGKQCASCLISICPEWDFDRPTQILKDEEMTGTGEPTLCPDCAAAGRSLTQYLDGEM